MRTVLFLAGLLAASPWLQAASEVATPPKHPLEGTWNWALFGGSCVETLQYRPKRSALSTSGQEVAEKTYQVSAQPDAMGFYKLVETVVRQNDKPDCSGAVLGGPGEQSTRFIQFSPRQDKLLVCQEASLKACFGPLTRVP